MTVCSKFHKNDSDAYYSEKIHKMRTRHKRTKYSDITTTTS